MDTLGRGLDVKRKLYKKQIEVLSKAAGGPVVPEQFEDLRNTFSSLENKRLIVEDGQQWIITPEGLETVKFGFYEDKTPPSARGLRDKPGHPHLPDEVKLSRHYNLRIDYQLKNDIDSYCKTHNIINSEFFRMASLKLISEYKNTEIRLMEDPSSFTGAIDIQNPLNMNKSMMDAVVAFCESADLKRSVFFRLAARWMLRSEPCEAYQNITSEIFGGGIDSLDKNKEIIKRLVVKIEIGADKGVLNRPAIKECNDLGISLGMYEALNTRLNDALKHAATVKNKLVIEKILSRIEKEALAGKIDHNKRHKCTVRGIASYPLLAARMKSAFDQAVLIRDANKPVANSR